MKLLDELGLWLLIGAPLGALWLAAVIDCARRPGTEFARGPSRGTWLAILVVTGFVGAAAWAIRRLVSRRGP